MPVYPAHNLLRLDGRFNLVNYTGEAEEADVWELKRFWFRWKKLITVIPLG
jgi:hypothetical protein